jgi:hypothetical protein
VDDPPTGRLVAVAGAACACMEVEDLAVVSPRRRLDAVDLAAGDRRIRIALGGNDHADRRASSRGQRSLHERSVTDGRAEERGPQVAIEHGEKDLSLGSPNLTLNSRTLGPASVSMMPAYSTPRYGVPSRSIRQAIGSKTSAATRSMASVPNQGTGV